MKIIIIGGVAGGMAAATRLRRLDESAEIIVLEAGPYVSFSNCGLPYRLGGVIDDRAAVLPRSPEWFALRFEIDVRVGHRVTSIDPRAATVTVDIAGTGQVDTLGYDELIIATGATADLPPTLVSDHTFALRTIDDMDAIAERLDRPDVRSVVIVGAGYIGLEAAENVRRRGLDTTLVQRGPQIFPALDPEMVTAVHHELVEHGITVLTSTTVHRVDRTQVTFDDGASIAADLVIDATGITPASALAEAAGLRIGAGGGIRVDGLHRSSDPHIYAIGDVAEKTDHVTGAPTLIALAGLANRDGRAVADAIAGIGEPTAPALGTSIIGVFGVTAAAVGWNETRLRAARRPHRIVHVHPSSHASFYPGGSALAMKLLIDPDTDLLLGAQVVGRDGVDKRIDVLAVAMSAGITASGLKNLELAYAPQYGSAKDPVNIAGYVAENTARALVRTVQWHELAGHIAAGASVVDVRTPAEYDSGHIPGALNVPLDEIRHRMDGIPAGRVIVHCQVGQRGSTATRILSQAGRDVTNLDGGYLTWLAGTTTTHQPTMKEALV
ncbi:FAD-dependent oxidoreductase [Herbiconiux ginsengi]|uniref:NADPH-dependent 2,4-dienoyl-CoA reductase, sulfur reductase n=1 Tax=Herbiconiux ginsengi TaxID=381665 RepID=A0A1H3S3A7_9MICO|nr:FAD-dependent oxidoreductase [Herbiconiux ginsengi]SDZ31961.1 NADPH-dependent 2,4-dienoyl-CoA reductase, sulfur reductase [Herbiconiux ginsengi]